MNDNIVPFYKSETSDLPVEVVLDGVKAKDLNSVLIIARLNNGEYYFASTNWDTTDMEDLVEALKREMRFG
jgi:hypothetical protein